jgi:hypothetical protein
MAIAVYLLCTITSLACAFLLFRGYLRLRERLLLWSALCFVGLTISNVTLLVDSQLAADLSTLRTVPSLIGVMLLVVGLVWDSHS